MIHQVKAVSPEEYPAGVRQREIPEALERINSQIHALKEKIGILEDRLQPICRPIEICANPICGGGGNDHVCEIAKILIEHQSLVTSCNDRIGVLIDSLQL